MTSRPPRPKTTQDQWEFTEALLKRLQISPLEQLPLTIDTFFESRTIRITQQAATLPSLANDLKRHVHPLLSQHIRSLDLHVKVSLRPFAGESNAYDRNFEVKDDHIQKCWDNLPMILSQLPKLKSFTLTLDSLFDSSPRPRDFQRLKLFRRGRLWGSRHENIMNSDFQEKATAILIPMLRGLARGKELDRVAVKHHPMVDFVDSEVVNGAYMSDEEVARQMLEKPGREVVLKGWHIGRTELLKPDTGLRHSRSVPYMSPRI